MQLLLVDDSPVYRKLITGHLQRWQFTYITAENGSQAWKLLQQSDSPKLVLLDWVLPDIDGIELCKRIRQERTSDSYVYVVLLTGKDGRENMLEAMEAGADDYLVKPFDEMELKSRLLVGKRILTLQDELVAAREAMRHAATHDSLTGLMNRVEIMDFLQRQLARGKREHIPVGLILADIDHFKNVNDSSGHLFGDEVLKETALRLRSHLRLYDGVGRYGGEEFLLVLPGCDSVTTLTRADEVRAKLAAKPIVSSNITKHITLSMGVSVWDASNPECAQALLSRADAGLYQAKMKGRNRVEHVDDATLSHVVSAGSH